MDTGEDANKHNEVEPKDVVVEKRRLDLSGGASSACSLCNLTFSGVQEQRSHIRSDLHRYNLKQKLKGLPVASEDDFESLVGGEKFRTILKYAG